MSTRVPDPSTAALRLAWSREHDDVLDIDTEYVVVSGTPLPAPLRYWYMETFLRRVPARPDDLGGFFMGHRTEPTAIDPDGRRLELRTVGDDGVVMDGVVAVEEGAIDLRVTVRNPTDARVNLQWASSCLQLAAFAGVPYELESYAFMPKSFMFVDGELRRLSEVEPGAPGSTGAIAPCIQHWLPAGVPLEDIWPDGVPLVPVSPAIPSNGLIGCFSADESVIVATAWSPTQTLHSARLCCLHASPRFGGLDAGEEKTAFGRIYVVGSVDELLERYGRDFGED